MAGIGAMGDLARINTNVGALNSYNVLTEKNRNIQQHQEHLATGKRINRAADSPANYVIAQKMTAKLNALTQAQENIGEAMAAMQEADSGIAQIHSIMLDMKQLAQQAETDTIGHDEREAIEYEIQQFAKEIDDIAEDTNWQRMQLLEGSVDWTLQVGEKVDDTLVFSLASGTETVTDEEGNVTQKALGFNSKDLGLDNLKSSSHEEAAASWRALNDATKKVLDAEERIGAVINRMSLKEDALVSAAANTSAAISRTVDTDIALSQMNLAKENILQQIALSMLAQNEQAPGAFLSLFR